MEISIPMNDFKGLWGLIRDEVLNAVDQVGSSGWFILGEQLRAFENELARTWPIDHVVGCASGLDALEIGLRCSGLSSGDRVLTTPLTAFATTLAILRAGGIPLFCDIGEDGQLSLEAAAEALDENPEIRFFVPVHLYGHPADLNAMDELAARFDLRVVEDCAQAVQATSRGRPVGTVGRVAATSFYPTKNLGALGDAGAVLTGSDEVAERARELRDYGQAGKYRHVAVGLNSRLDEVHAAILKSALLPRLPAFTSRRREVAARYILEIENPLVSPILPGPGAQSAWHLFPVLVRNDAEGFRRFLAGRGIQTARHYPVLCPDQPCMSNVEYLTHGDLRTSRRFAHQQVSLPIHPGLDDNQVEKVIQASNEWLA